MPILPICYFAPIAWYSLYRQYETVAIEVQAHYLKQQCSSRMWIRMPSGAFPLTIPVERDGNHIAIRDKKISYAERWHQMHWKSLQTAYSNAPYFEYYEDKLAALYQKKPVFLLDFLLATHEIAARILQLDTVYSLTEIYEKEVKEDFRSFFPAKSPCLPEGYTAKFYTQVFDNGGFISGLSILDLLLNEGPSGVRKLGEWSLRENE